MIEAADIAPAAGKTHKIALKSIENLNKGESTVILCPTHKACQEVITKMPVIAAQEGTVVHLYGKNEQSCRPMYFEKKKQCKQCPIFKKIYAGVRDEVIQESKGQILSLDKLQALAVKHDLCPLVTGRIVANSDLPKVVIATHAFLSSPASMNLLEDIETQHIYVDEGDQVFDVLLQSGQRKITLMYPRQSKDYRISERCNRNCSQCVPSFADGRRDKLIPPGGRLQDKTDASNEAVLVETIRKAVATVKSAIDEGVIKDIFNIAAAENFVNTLEKKIPKYEPKTSPLDYLISLENHNKEDRVGIFEEDEGNEDYAISIPMQSFLKDDADVLEDVFDQGFVHQVNINSLKKIIFTDEKIQDSTIESFEPHISIFIQLVDFSSAAEGSAFLLPAKRILDGGDVGADHCSLELRCLSRKQYVRVAQYLDGAKMVSGTFLDKRMMAVSLLTSPDQIDFKDASYQFHDAAILIVHTPCERAKPPIAPFYQKDAIKLFKEIEDKKPGVKILSFAVNTKVANAFFKEQSGLEEVTKRFRVELTENGSVKIDETGSAEREHGERTAVLTIDKLRSSTSRAANRNFFDVCAIIGNGIANWNDRIMLYLEAKKVVPEITMRGLVQYEQKRAVVQALLRAPRTPERTVCFYAGNLQRLALPQFLWNRIITTDTLLRDYESDTRVKISDDDVKKLEVQIKAIAHGAVKFLSGSEPSFIPHKEEPEAKTAANDKLDHIRRCIEERGFIDKVADKRGERPAWQAYLDELVEKKVLKIEKRGRKSMFFKGDLWE